MSLKTDKNYSLKIFFNKHKKAKYIIAPILGAVAGYLYYYYIGCSGGTCPITSSPYISTAWGAAIGLLLVK